MMQLYATASESELAKRHTETGFLAQRNSHHSHKQLYRNEYVCIICIILFVYKKYLFVYEYACITYIASINVNTL